jgi:hypothetical protein
MANSSNYALRMPMSLKKAVEEFARQDGTTINQFIVTAVAEKLSALKAVDFFAERAAQGDIDWARSFLGRKGGEAPSEEDKLPEGYKK